MRGHARSRQTWRCTSPPRTQCNQPQRHGQSSWRVCRGRKPASISCRRGENARTYIATARKLGGDESTCDLLGIQITRANAELVRLAIGSMASSKIPTTLSDLPHFVGSGKAVVMGGLQPGQSTNAVAALAAEITRAEILVNGTDVDGVYTEDPKKNPKAKLIRSVHVDKLLNWAMGGEVFAGRYELLDPLAIKIMQRARIPTRFVSLGDPANIMAALQGKDIGTKVVYS